ncbi:MAG: valine--tRNA ligase [Gammaproteobacteria bacterium]|nr:valine--tRNA ligase [Gammaproteobacteria bacterium]
MEKTYDPHAIEQTLYNNWEALGYFHPGKKGAPYCIMLPPPNVTGSLHMGHGFQNALMDALIRFHRMKGDNTLWQGGVDHAGIATQMVVERQLLAKGKTRRELGREKFLEKVWAWKNESGDTINRQLRRLGSSIDWSRSRFTMDEGLSQAVQKVFIDLYDEGLIYRGHRLVNWDTKFHTAISDLEVINEEEDGHLWYIRYPLVNSPDVLIIATTRPETMLGDTAIAVHPDDTRYQHLIGKKAKLPLTDREIPIIADEYVDPEFGTGCVKITPAHDFNDYEVGKRHQLPIINILTFDAHINENAPEKYQGMDRFEARDKIVEDLKALELIEKIEKHKLKVPRGDRSKTIIEPWLTAQWFVKTKPLAETAIKAVEDGDIRFIPDTWTKTYFQWMYNIEDWCISRQLWWGHRIPAWYDEQGNIYVGENEENVRAKYKLEATLPLRQDEDVLDTWFSSALWPFSTLGWPENTAEFNTFYPTNVLVTGFDIIFFWVARMIMFGLKFTGKIPFHEVYVTGLIRDQEGQKMSKSKGNVLDPIDLIDGVSLDDLLKKRTFGLMQPEMEKRIKEQTCKQFPNGIAAHGTDALRLTFCSLASTGRDIRFDLGRLEGCRNFCNKLWNAARYVLMQTDMANCDLTQTKAKSLADRWIESRLQRTILSVHQHFNDYRFDLITQNMYEFTWHEFCDWYLELSKTVLTSPKTTEEEKNATKVTLLTTLETLLRLLHPLIPFITESLWKEVSPLLQIHSDTIMLEQYPALDESKLDADVEADIEWIKKVVFGLRNLRSEMNIPPSKQLAIYINQGSEQDQSRIQMHQQYLKDLAKLQSIETTTHPTDACATVLVETLEIAVPFADLIDVQAEKDRLNKEIQKLEKELSHVKNKLSNENFIARAPEAIVKKEQTHIQDLQTALQQLHEKLESIKTIA